ncbi:MAG: hypothetical protein ABI629_26560 [bacterium]
MVAAACLAAMLAEPRASAAESGEAATFGQCYKSIRACQKGRCSKADDQDQVACVRQCNREYETCVSGAGAGSGSVGDILGFPKKAFATPKPNMRRNKPQSDPN